MQQNTFNYLTFFLWLASCYRKPDSGIMNDRALSKFSNQCFYTKVHVGFNEIMARSLFSGSVDSTELTVLPYYCSETDEVPGCKFHILVSTKVPFPFLNEHVCRLHNRTFHNGGTRRSTCSLHPVHVVIILFTKQKI